MTAELAVALPGVVLVVAVLLATLAAAGLQLRAAEAARTGARVAALGLGDGAVSTAAREVAPGSSVEVSRDPPWVQVRVTISAAGSIAGPLEVAASATASASTAAMVLSS
ncbi:MAG TPA: TadE family type IV pilus minor pilin, partial [Actinotalea sp.]|nr:TadE family type IV pilus minor pilin [Actinotalea sp.]